MTDKVAIRREIERLIKLTEHRIDNHSYVINEAGMDEDETRRVHALQDAKLTHLDGEACALQKLLSFINSLPEEPVSEDLEDAAYDFVMNNYGDPKEPLYKFDQRCFKAGAKWKDKTAREEVIEKVGDILFKHLPIVVDSYNDGKWEYDMDRGEFIKMIRKELEESI